MHVLMPTSPDSSPSSWPFYCVAVGTAVFDSFAWPVSHLICPIRPLLIGANFVPPPEVLGKTTEVHAVFVL